MKTDRQLQTLYGMKYNPFQPELPQEALWTPPGTELYGIKLERLVHDGGFGLILGQAGVGKSKLMQSLEARLSRMPDILVGVVQRPQSSLGDLYRELGELFGVRLAPSNRYASFKSLRERWLEHIRTSLFRPVLFIDEAQEAHSECLTELRLISSDRFDSRALLTVVLSGDLRLLERLRCAELLPLGSRISARILLEPLSVESLMDFLSFALEQAAAPQLMSAPLKQILCEHAAGNLRVLTQMASDLLQAAVARDLAQLDEKLFIELFSIKPRQRRTGGLAAPSKERS